MIEKKTETNKNIFIIEIIILVVCWIEILVFWKKIPPQIPWFYSYVWGEKQLMNKGGLIWVMGAATGLAFITSFIANWAKKEDTVVEKAVFITLVLASFLLLLSLTKVLMIFVA